MSRASPITFSGYFYAILFNLKISQDSLAGILAKDFPQYYSLKYDVEVAEAKKVMESLNPNEAVLSYFLGDSIWYVAGIMYYIACSM